MKKPEGNVMGYFAKCIGVTALLFHFEILKLAHLVFTACHQAENNG